MLGVSIDPWPSSGAFAKSLGLSFPLISDWPKNETCRAYDVFDESRSVARRVAYVIDKQGIIRGMITDQQDMSSYAKESLRIIKELEGKP